ncbi:hypothetical protein P4H82_27815 [Bacillus cereus]|nr:hypothetical protein [Bacillus cereus]MEB9190673.1 hypothetical protein [Bacillus cereus]
MCKYCKTDGYHRTELIEAEWIDIRIEGNKLSLDYQAYSCDSSFEEGVKINFCPMCGKELIEPPVIDEDEDEDDE